MRINIYYSEWCEVISGIPQGSVFGPLLFIIYINDLPNVDAEFAEISLFADDAKISITYYTVLMINYYYKVNKAGDWPKLWFLSLNIIKCIVTINTYHINTISGNVNLQCVNCTKDLGIIVDNNLSFAEYM